MDKKDRNLNQESKSTYTASKLNEASKISEKKKDSPVKKKIKNKVKLGCCAGVFGFLCVCISIFIALWLSGYVQKWTCNVVEKNSVVWNTLDCVLDTTQSGQDEGEYKYNVIDKSGEILITDIETVVTKVVEESSSAVVGIGLKSSETLSSDQIVGTGFVVTSNGLIVTNQHVVSQGVEKDYFVILSGQSDPVKVEKIYRDQLNDIAIIKINKDSLSSLPLGDSDKLKVGQTVIAIGNPMGSLTGTVTSGIISGLNRDVQVGSQFFYTTSETFEDVIQTDAAINPGNSGGPLINSQGEVIGVNFATIQGADNLSFALPINRVKSRIGELNKYGDFRIPYIGIEYRQRVIFIDNQTVVGAMIINILTGGPADRAGLKKNDVIVQFNGQTLEDKTLFTLVQKAGIGKEVEVVIIRDGVQRTVKLVVGERGEYE